MSKIKGLLLGFLIFSLLTFTSGCGSSSSSVSQSGEEKITIRFAYHLKDSFSLGKQVSRFEKLVEKKSDGKVEVKVYSNGQLGDQKALLDGLQQGTVDMSLGDAGVVANFYPKIGILDLPYVFKSIEHAKAAVSGALGDNLKKGISEQTDFITLGIEPLSYRSTVLNEKVQSFQDFSGSKIRTLPSPIIVNTFKSFGVQPASLSTGEAFSAMETGTVDGMESNPEFLKSINAWEVADYFVDTRHNLTFETINISKNFYNNLPDKVQKIIKQSINETMDWFNKNSINFDKKSRKALKEHGVEFLDINIEPFKKAAKPAVKKYIKENDLQKMYKLIQDAAKEK
ncbi:TRAP transporter substrate-binding protein [Tuberibacillus sp. Marseille-P3662]|uniref:TRAP transporter substrate-binding protein n=1 Tax=Tuberibacillus sp. Marseille-P3662 TaxID=1965358 RepID=UPI000A1C9EE3|nr:TRAP transporter substrate-binding protein [Tuberibacillus sp. Marseille-P3662]